MVGFLWVWYLRSTALQSRPAYTHDREIIGEIYV